MSSSPLRADVAVFVSIDNTLVQGWSRIFSSYIELTEAGIWRYFVADDELRAGRAKLEDYKILFIPELTFASEDIITRLLKYAQQGGRTLDYYRKRIFGVTSLKCRKKTKRYQYGDGIFRRARPGLDI